MIHRVSYRSSGCVVHRPSSSSLWPLLQCISGWPRHGLFRSSSPYGYCRYGTAGSKPWLSSSSSSSSYSIAICRQLPDSFDDALSKHYVPSDRPQDTTASSSSTATTSILPFSWEMAQKQHTHYIQALRSILPVIELPALPEYPDCPFVEDTVVVIGKKAVITQIGHCSRRGEVDSVKGMLRQLGVDVSTDMREYHSFEHSNGDDDDATDITPSTAYCDGGDVLFTGRHIFVGLSHRTNAQGVAILTDTWGDTYPVIPIRSQGEGGGWGDEVLHLKSVVTHLTEDTLLVPRGRLGDIILTTLPAHQLGYTVIRVPDPLACNVVAVNGTILVQDTPCQLSRNILENAVKERNLKLIWVDTSELAKKDAALTCCSVLLDI